MKYLGWVVIIIGLTACSSSAKKSPETAAVDAETAALQKKLHDENLVTCSQNSDVRALEIKKLKPVGCELFYTKFGSAKSIASSATGEAHCTDIREKIYSNLTRSGFKCE